MPISYLCPYYTQQVLRLQPEQKLKRVANFLISIAKTLVLDFIKENL